MNAAMNKTLIFLLLMLPVSLFAQRYPTGKGTFRTGGGCSFSESTQSAYNQYKFTITPRLGYFISDELSVGFSSNFTTTLDTAFTLAVKFTPEFKYYYGFSEAAYLIGNMQFGIDRATTFDNGRFIIDHSSIAAGPGFAYFFSRRVGFEIDIMYQQYVSPDALHQSKVIADGAFVFNLLSFKERVKEYRKKNYRIDDNDDD